MIIEPYPGSDLGIRLHARTKRTISILKNGAVRVGNIPRTAIQGELDIVVALSLEDST